MFSLDANGIDSNLILHQHTDKKPESRDSLSRFVLMDPEAQAKSAKCYKIFWKVLEISSLVAFTMLAVIAAIWTGIVAPIYLPITSVIVITLLPVVFKIYSFLNSKSEINARSERLESKVFETMAKLPKSKEDFIKHLEKLEVKVPASLSPTDLKPLAARYELCEELHGDAVKEIGKLKTKMVIPEKADKVQKYRLKILQLSEVAELHKINAAYFLGILQSPYDQRELSDLAKLAYNLPYPDEGIIFTRLVAEKFGDESANVLIQFKGDKSGTTIEELKKMSTEAVSKSLFQTEGAPKEESV